MRIKIQKMKFKHLFLFAFALILSSGVQAQIKIAYINLELVMAYLPEVQNVNKELQTYQTQLTKSLKTKQDYFDLKYQEYQEAAQHPDATAETLAPLQQELQKLQVELQQSLTISENQIVQKQNTLMNPILETVQKELQAIAAEKNYDYVLNSASSGSSIILHASEANDISELLLNRLGVEIPKD